MVRFAEIDEKKEEKSDTAKQYMRQNSISNSEKGSVHFGIHTIDGMSESSFMPS